jgi:hypothetical protein
VSNSYNTYTAIIAGELRKLLGVAWKPPTDFYFACRPYWQQCYPPSAAAQHIAKEYRK